MMTAKEIIDYMESLRDEGQREILMRFFKTAPGEYGYGDEFLGLKVPQTREVVKAAKDTPQSEIPELLMSPWHEVRLCGLLLLVSQFERLATKRLVNDAEAIRKRDEIVTFYLKYAERANNWDLVDLSVHKIIGHWLLLPTALGGGEIGLHQDYKLKTLDALAQSNNLWKQRMSIVCTWKTSQQGDPSWCLRYAEIHLHHPHDLMHKAVGWMLREMGKRVSMDLLRDFLRQHVHEMPRTTLRYAIEKMTDEERRQWMAMPTEENRSYTEHKTKAISFAGKPIPDFVDIILKDKEKSDEAMYYLLHQRLNRPLHERFETYRHQLWDDFEDVVEDFFLYLREGKDGRNRTPYQSLRQIKKRESFESWLLNTFRNYLSNRADTERHIDTTTITNECRPSDFSASPITDEQQLSVASQLIAYAHQVFYPRGRFIFLRSLLTLLNKQKALPDKEIAEALQMTHLAYRVMAHRMKGNLATFRQRLLQGEHLRLDDEHQQMASHIYNDFTNLYTTLVTYYTQTIETLRCRDAIKYLRQQYYDSTGFMLHEPSPDDGSVIITPHAFWHKFSRWLLL